MLTGRPGCGKTTIVQRVLKDYAGGAGGFYTREIRKSGVRVGFEVVCLDGRHGILAHVDKPSGMRVSKYGVDLTFLEGVGLPSVRQAIKDKLLVVIDEIGPMENFSKLFRTVVVETFESDVPVLATIVQRPTIFGDAIKRRQDIDLIEVTPDNRNQIPGQIIDMLQGEN